MNDADRALAELAAKQRHVFTRSQARAVGLSSSDINYRVARGLFVACGTRTLHFAGTTLDWRGRLQAGLLDLGPDALIAGHAAAAIHRFDGFEEGSLGYAVPRQLRNRRTNGPVISIPAIGPLDRVEIDGLAVCSPTLAIALLVGRCRADQLGDALDSATRRRLTAASVVQRRLEQLGRQGRHGVREFDRLLEAAGVESGLERKFLALIGRAGLPKPCCNARTGPTVDTSPASTSTSLRDR